MLEQKAYTKAEISEIAGTKDRQSIKDKLNTLGITYSIEGNGNNAIFAAQIFTNHASRNFLASSTEYGGI